MSVVRWPWCSSSALSAQEFFNLFDFRFGHVEILLCALRVLALHKVFGLRNVCLHALFGSDDVSAKSVALSRLLTLQTIETMRHRSGAALELVQLMLCFLRQRGVCRRGLSMLAPYPYG